MAAAAAYGLTGADLLQVKYFMQYYHANIVMSNDIDWKAN
jgi:hypothetical protein